MAVLRHIHICVGVFTACLYFTCWREATFFLEQWTQTNVSAHNQWACTVCVYGYSHSVGIKWMPVEREIIRARENERKGKKHVEVNKQNRSDRPKESYGKESVTLWTISTATNSTSKLRDEKLKNKTRIIYAYILLQRGEAGRKPS